MLTELAKALTVEILHVPNAIKDDGTPDPSYGGRAYRWRLKMAAVTSATAIAVAVLSLRIYGVYGEPFAASKDLNDVKAGQLEAKIEKYQTALCMNPGDPALLELVRELQRQYWDITSPHRHYDTPSCDVLFKAHGS